MFSRIATPIFFFIAFATWGQNVSVRGRFLADSVHLGEPVIFTLTAKYPSSADILFPDSTFAGFKPFEFQKKIFFVTSTKDSLSYDSAVYEVATFEIDSLQSLKLPVYLVHGKDCTAIFTSIDTLRFIGTVASVPDSVTTEKLPLKTDTAYRPVRWLLNYPVILIIGGVLIVLLIAAWLVFGKRIRKYYILKRLARNHQVFVDRYNALAQDVATSASRMKAEEAVIEWKKYVENLASKPFTKYTSKEILEQEHNEMLGKALHSMDRLIYGGVTEMLEPAFATLRDYTTQLYQQKTEEIKHG